jgi:protocatechuate 3,4-dioxygenase beta subunit
MKRAPRLFLAVAAALLFTLTLSAQRDKGKKEDPNIRTAEGTVLDLEQKPLAGAIVQLKDMRTLQVRSFVTQENGQYHFASLRTDTDYELQAVSGQLKSDVKRLSTFDSRKTATIVLQLEKK